MITHHLISAFRAVIATSPADLLPMVYLCTNRVAPAHDGVELGIGDAILIKVGWLAGWLAGWLGYTVAWLLGFWLAGDRHCRTIALHRR